MKNKIVPIFLIANCLLLSANCFSQAAGNSVYNGQADNYKSERGYFDNNYDKNVQQNAQFGAYSYNAGTASAYVSNDTMFELSVSALMNVEANSYVALFGVSQVGESIDSCHRLINERINNFIAQLAQAGVKKEDIYVDFVSQVPVFEYSVEKKIFSKKYNEIPSGFELKKNVHVAYKKNDNIDQILLIAAKNEIYDIIKVDYVINNMEAVYDTLRKEAIKRLNIKAEDYKKLGIKFNPKFQVMAEDVRSVYPIERYKKYAAYNNSSITALKKSGVSSNSISQAPKNATLYYDKLPYDEFEIIINPKVIQPVAQFTYMLKVRYAYRGEYSGKTAAPKPQ